MSDSLSYGGILDFRVSERTARRKFLAKTHRASSIMFLPTDRMKPMNDMFGRKVEVGDLVLISSADRIKLVRITKYNPKTNRVSVKIVDRSTMQEEKYGWHTEYFANRLMLVRDLDLVSA